MVLLRLFDYQGALTVRYHRLHSFYRRRLFVAYGVTLVVNSMNSIWVGVAGALGVPDFIYNILTTLLIGGVSMVIFFIVNKMIFPEGEAKKKDETVATCNSLL